MYKGPMARTTAGVLLVIAMIVVVVATDVVFFRGSAWTWERLAANVGIVLVFGALYFRFIRSS
jgi:hypothetical protein